MTAKAGKIHTGRHGAASSDTYVKNREIIAVIARSRASVVTQRLPIFARSRGLTQSVTAIPEQLHVQVDFTVAPRMIL